MMSVRLFRCHRCKPVVQWIVVDQAAATPRCWCGKLMSRVVLPGDHKRTAAAKRPASTTELAELG